MMGLARWAFCTGPCSRSALDRPPRLLSGPRHTGPFLLPFSRSAARRRIDRECSKGCFFETSDDLSFTFNKMHGFSTVDGFVEITESLAEMIKEITSNQSAYCGLRRFYYNDEMQGEKHLIYTDEPSSVAETSSSSTLPVVESDELPLSSEVSEELQEEKGGESHTTLPLPSDHLLPVSEDFESFKANREAKLEEWLGETGHRNNCNGATNVEPA
ncbi:hypothetical protein NL676_037348 [Syzygium grande]|nr:hypothetical protein NL676_037348 [Syzygium grande]